MELAILFFIVHFYGIYMLMEVDFRRVLRLEQREIDGTRPQCSRAELFRCCVGYEQLTSFAVKRNHNRRHLLSTFLNFHMHRRS